MSRHFASAFLHELLPALGFCPVNDSGTYWLRDAVLEELRSQLLVLGASGTVSLREVVGIDQHELAEALVASPADLTHLLRRWV